MVQVAMLSAVPFAVVNIFNADVPVMIQHLLDGLAFGPVH